MAMPHMRYSHESSVTMLNRNKRICNEDSQIDKPVRLYETSKITCREMTVDRAWALGL